MLDKRYRRYVQSFLLVLPMTAIVTTINTLVAKGIEAIVTVATLEKWAISLAVAFPAVLLMAPIALRLTNKFVKDE